MSFEAFNAIVIRAANRSNFKNETNSVLVYWSMKSAIALKKKCSADWLADCDDDASVAHDVDDEDDV